MHLLFPLMSAKQDEPNIMECRVYKGNNKITELRAILQRESQKGKVYKQTKSVNNRKNVKTAMTLTWYRHF